MRQHRRLLAVSGGTKSRVWVAGGLLAGMILLAAIAVGYRRFVTPRRTSTSECQGAAACEEACNAGDTCACGALGALYLHGNSVGRNARRGLSLLDRACDTDCATACWALGNAYQSSAGVRADTGRANGYFERLNTLCRKGCDDGDPDRCFTLAGSYLGGHGVAGDHARAEELYRRSGTLYGPLCDQGDAHACARLAVLLDHGLGVEESKQKATAAYEAACGLGDLESCEEAAKRYTGRDKDLPKDEKRSAELAHKACAKGRSMGCALANEPDDFMSIVQAACAAGSAFDCGSAAFALTNGAHGVQRDPGRAAPLAARMIELEQDACLDDDGSACMALVRPFETGSAEGEPEGTILPKDPTRVLALKQRACELGYKSACATAPTAPPSK
jgi:TPR repeat protein